MGCVGVYWDTVGLTTYTYVHAQIGWAKSLNDEFLNEQQYRMNQVQTDRVLVVVVAISV